MDEKTPMGYDPENEYAPIEPAPENLTPQNTAPSAEYKSLDDILPPKEEKNAGYVPTQMTGDDALRENRYDQSAPDTGFNPQETSPQELYRNASAPEMSQNVVPRQSPNVTPQPPYHQGYRTVQSHASQPPYQPPYAAPSSPYAAQKPPTQPPQYPAQQASQTPSYPRQDYGFTPQDPQYSQNQQNSQNSQNPQNPYAGRANYQNFNPYQPGPHNPYTAPAPKPKTPVGTKIFLAVISALLVFFIIFFVIFLVQNFAKNSANNAPDFNSMIPFATEAPSQDDRFDILEPGRRGTKFEEEIELIADNGETQQRENDNEASVGKPDKNAKGVSLEGLPSDKNSEKYTVQSAYDAVCDSVVSVLCYTEKITDNAADIVSQGTGTIISEDGYIITNAHVIGNSKSLLINIILNSGDEYRAKVVGYDTWTDLAVLKIDAKKLKAVTFGNSDLINIGDDVIAIGNPGGTNFKNSLTKGIVSAVDRELAINKNVKYIQSDAAINPGNSGGPLCNIYGRIIGINSAKITSSLYEGMSFSIPSVTVETIVNDLIHNGYVKDRVRIGFSGFELTEQDVYYYEVPQGIYIDAIDENGALGGTDIRKGDIIYSIDGIDISTFQDVYDILADHRPGDKITLGVYRSDLDD